MAYAVNGHFLSMDTSFQRIFHFKDLTFSYLGSSTYFYINYFTAISNLFSQAHLCLLRAQLVTALL